MYDCDNELRKHIRQDKAYKTMRSFILSEFSKGEILSLYDVLRRYYGKHPGSTTFDNWDVAILFGSAVSSLCQEGKMHIYANGRTTEYILDMPEESKEIQQATHEER